MVDLLDKIKAGYLAVQMVERMAVTTVVTTVAMTAVVTAATMVVWMVEMMAEPKDNSKGDLVAAMLDLHLVDR